MRTRGWTALVLLFLGAPLFLNLRESHNWGDDFAMYILQARNIVDGRPQDNGYVYAPEMALIGPPAYPVGFPLLLAPTYAAYGNSMRRFVLLMSVFAVLFGWLAYAYFRIHMPSRVHAAALAGLLVFNPWLVEFKASVLSDVPFSLFCLGVIALEESPARPSRARSVLLALALAFALLTRANGIALLAALAAARGVALVRGRLSGGRWGLRTRELAELWSAIAVALAVPGLVFPALSPGSYFDLVQWGSLPQVAANNALYYMQVTKQLIPASGPSFVQALLGDFLIVAGILGFIGRVRRDGVRVSDAFVLFHMGLLLAWPGEGQGYRFVLPVVPMLLIYYFEFTSWITSAFVQPRAQPWSLAAVAGLLAALYVSPVLALEGRKAVPVEGPQLPEAGEAYRYVREHLPPGAVVVAWKPRALALYGERKGLAEPGGWDPEDLRRHFQRLGATHILVDEVHTDDGVKRYVEDPWAASLIWANGRFRLYAATYP